MLDYGDGRMGVMVVREDIAYTFRATLLALATMPLMAAFGATFALAVGAIGLGALRGRNRGVPGSLGRPSEPVDLPFDPPDDLLERFKRFVGVQ